MPQFARDIRDRTPTFHPRLPLYADEEEQEDRNQPDHHTIREKAWRYKTNIFQSIRLIPQDVVKAYCCQAMGTGPALVALAYISLGAPSTRFASTCIPAFTLGLGIADTTSPSHRLERSFLRDKSKLSYASCRDTLGIHGSRNTYITF